MKKKTMPSRPAAVKKAKESPAEIKQESKVLRKVCSVAVLKFEKMAQSGYMALLPAEEKFDLEEIMRERKGFSKRKPFLEGMGQEEVNLLETEEDELPYEDEYDYEYEEEEEGEGLPEQELVEIEEEEIEEEVDEEDEEESVEEEEDEDYRY